MSKFKKYLEANIKEKHKKFHRAKEVAQELIDKGYEDEDDLMDRIRTKFPNDDEMYRLILKIINTDEE